MKKTMNTMLNHVNIELDIIDIQLFIYFLIYISLSLFVIITIKFDVCHLTKNKVLYKFQK